MTLAAHAAEVGADAVVVIGPPYFKLDEQAQYAHFFAAATACAPTPFYVYEFAVTTGYAIAPAVLERLRDDVDNVVGLKVSDTPFEAFEKYLLPGFDIFVGPEALIADGMAPVPSEPFRRWRQPFRARSPLSCVSRHRRAPPAWESCAASWSASRGRQRSSGCSRSRACP